MDVPYTYMQQTVTAQRALDVETTLKFSLEQRNDPIYTKFRRCSNVMYPLGEPLIITSIPARIYRV